MTARTVATSPRAACVDVPALPLQLLLARNAGWAECAAAVVAEDRPQGVILWVNTAARKRRVLPGMRYATALSLAPDLRAGVVAPEEIAAGVATGVERLLRFTPGVEPSRDEPGVFHLDASGLSRLFPRLADWAVAIRTDLAAVGLRSRISVGFTRFGVYATARVARGVVVFDDPAAEERTARDVPLDRLGVDPALRDALAKLGVRTVGAFLDLPEGGLLKRFGKEAQSLHRFASGAAAPPLTPQIVEPPPEVRIAFEFPETDMGRLLFLVKERLHEILARVAARREALVEIAIRLVLDGAPPVEERLRPAAPTLEALQILDLVHLRLSSLQLRAGVEEMTLTATGTPATEEQLRLFVERPRRDLAAADRALARLTAEFGEGAVVVAALRDGHLPEASFAWEPFGRTVLPRPRIVPEPPLVRRIYETPRELAPRTRREPDGWMLGAFEDGRVVRSSGPYSVSTGWWTGEETRREYVFAESAKGRLFWTFHAPHRTRWFLQGRVE